MVTIKRSTSKNLDFIALVKLLDADLKLRDGDDHDFYAQFNGIVNLPYVVLAYWKNKPVGCGAIKEHNSTTMEIKRMFVAPNECGKGIASMILKELEKWAAEKNYSSCILETGLRQPEAIALYKKNGYLSIPNYGQYKGMSNSVCFIKKL
ncbi:GNAT family N-acetyltransferase [Arenibacter sp. BSSL-BM3]|uniref:GNAT family N-acetyltransferase n=1 Tax=Arenibacter arenosicollis TaxID=2762274 RepID=A0ABR7QQH6_9FLAO|nr:GNAT family N-acetyltransferase [Arenibacter arenosicollis]MBC8769452.1 GNAT family N-acetyltransferase [Arenibacter arenosicollis]